MSSCNVGTHGVLPCDVPVRWVEWSIRLYTPGYYSSSSTDASGEINISYWLPEGQPVTEVLAALTAMEK